MATFKAVVQGHHKKTDGTYNIKIRIIHNRKIKYIGTPWYVSKNDLTKSLKLKNHGYIDMCDDLIRTYRKRCDVYGERLQSMTVDQVIDIITRPSDEHFSLDIIEYARKYIKELRESGHMGNARVYEIAIDNLVKYAGRERIDISEITANFISGWIKWITAQPAPSRKEKGNRAQSLYPAQLRAIHNRAKAEFNDEDNGIVRIPLSPFAKIKLPKVPVSRKRALTVEQMRAIVSLEYTDNGLPFGQNRFNLAKDVFLISFGLLGMNAVDLYNCTDYRNGRITYQRSKTKNRRADRAEISVKVEPEIAALIEKYRDEDGERVFGFYHWYSRMDSFSSALNYGLKKIGKIIGVEDLEFYAARHSWATIALNDAGIDKYTVHTALNHVDESMKVTDIYIRKSWMPIDKANRVVLNLLYDIKE